MAAERLMTTNAPLGFSLLLECLECALLLLPLGFLPLGELFFVVYGPNRLILLRIGCYDARIKICPASLHRFLDFVPNQLGTNRQDLTFSVHIP